MTISHETTTYQGATLSLPGFLIPLLPPRLPLCRWPTYCGAGEGLGDILVPDFIKGACVGPACLIHDLDWALCSPTFREFSLANFRFFRNLLALCAIQLPWHSLPLAYLRCLWYTGVVMSVGWPIFLSSAEGPISPYRSATVRDRLNKLAWADMGLPTSTLVSKRYPYTEELDSFEEVSEVGDAEVE